jgi:hypothetical protein
VHGGSVLDFYFLQGSAKSIAKRQLGSPSLAGLERRDKPIRSGGILVSPLGETGGAGGFGNGFTGADAALGTAGFGTAGFGF